MDRPKGVVFDFVLLGRFSDEKWISLVALLVLLSKKSTVFASFGAQKKLFGSSRKEHCVFLEKRKERIEGLLLCQKRTSI